jgi:gamma-glutamyltranspeptidase/glutathione hydrolase
MRPLSTTYRGYEIFAEPPVSPGIVTLMALQILERFDLGAYEPQSPLRYHLLIEAFKLAFEDRTRLGDPWCVENPVEVLLSAAHADAQAARIDLKRARACTVPIPDLPGTDSIVFGDARGNVVAYIHSLFASCGEVMGNTGILMNGRMAGFSLDPRSPNVVAPGKRPMHTLGNFIVHDREGRFMLAGGTPGGNFQIQMNVQLLTNILDHGMSLSEASDAPRITVGLPQTIDEATIRIESRLPPDLGDELAVLGHNVERIGPWGHLSAMQVISRHSVTGVYRGATDIRRADCCVAGL